MKDRFYCQIKKLKGVKIYKNVNVKEDTTLKIEALFSYKIEIFSFVITKRVFELIKKYNKKYYILGNGSNVLLANEYYDYVLIKLMPFKMRTLNIIGGGESINYLNNIYLSKGISSIDFLCGVPCSVGGALYMNAGAFSESVSDIVEYVYCYDISENRFKVFNNKQCDFSYRDSYFKHHNTIILGAKIRLNYMDKDKLILMHHDRITKRSKNLPLEYPNIGSIFKNPSNNYAGKLIEDLGLKGLKVGGSMVSNKHGNVFVNYDGCKGRDFLKLIEMIEEEVYMKYKIKLEREIIVFK